MLRIVFILILNIGQYVYANRILPPQTRPDKFHYTPGCYNADLDKVLSFNTSYSPQDGSTCLQYTCDYDGYTYITSCLNLEANCALIPGNKSLIYPLCCDQLDCTKNKLNNSQNKYITSPVKEENVTEQIDTNEEKSGANKNEDDDGNVTEELREDEEGSGENKKGDESSLLHETSTSDKGFDENATETQTENANDNNEDDFEPQALNNLTNVDDEVFQEHDGVLEVTTEEILQTTERAKGKKRQRQKVKETEIH